MTKALKDATAFEQGKNQKYSIENNSRISKDFLFEMVVDTNTECSSSRRTDSLEHLRVSRAKKKRGVNGQKMGNFERLPVN